MPEWSYVLYGQTYALPGMCLGCAIRWGKELRTLPRRERSPLQVFALVWACSLLLPLGISLVELVAVLFCFVLPIGEVFVSHLRQWLGTALFAAHCLASCAAALWAGMGMARREGGAVSRKWRALPLFGLACAVGAGFASWLVPLPWGHEPWLPAVLFLAGMLPPALGMAWGSWARRRDA